MPVSTCTSPKSVDHQLVRFRRLLSLALILASCRTPSEPPTEPDSYDQPEVTESTESPPEAPPPPEPPAPPPGFSSAPNPPADPTLLVQTSELSVGSAYSPDGKLLATIGSSLVVRIWDVQRGKIRAFLTGLRSVAHTVAFSPDGTLVAAGEDPSGVDVKHPAVHVWDVTTGAHLGIFEGHSANVWAVTFSPDGRTIASGGLDNQIHLFDARTGSLKRTLTGHTAAVTSLAFSPDGQRLASGGYGNFNTSGPPTERNDRTIRIWSVDTGQQLGQLMGHTSPVVRVAFAGSDRLISNGEDSSLRMWDLKTFTQLRSISPWYGREWAVRGDRLVAGSYGECRVFRTEDFQELVHARTEAEVRSIAFSPTSEEFVVGTLDGIEFHDVATAKLNRRWKLPGASGAVSYFEANTPISMDVRTDGLKRFEIFRETWTGAERLRTPPHDYASALVVSRDRRRFGMVVLSAGLSVFDIQSGALLGTQKIEGSSYSLAASPDGQAWAMTDDKSVWIYDVSTKAERFRVITGKYPGELDFSPDGRLLAMKDYTGAEGERVGRYHFLESSTGALVATIGGVEERFGILSQGNFSPDGRLFAFSQITWERKVQVYDVATRTLVREVTVERNPGALAWSPDSQSFVITVDGTAQFFDTRTWQKTRSIKTEGTSAGFSADGALFFSGSKVFRLSDGEHLNLAAFDLKGRHAALYYTDQGLFAGDDEAFDEVMVRMPGRVDQAELLSIGQLFSSFYAPSLVTDFLAGRPFVAGGKLEAVGPAPLVEFIDVPPAEVTSEKLTVRWKVTDRGGGVGEKRIFVNGARVRGEDRGIKRVGESLEVILTPGDNEITADALSIKGSVRSDPAVIRVRLRTKDPERPNLYVVATTLDEYDDPAQKLDYANADGAAVVAALAKQKGRLYKDVFVTKLVDRAATRARVEKELSQLEAKVRPSDVVIFYAAGHGMIARCGSEMKYHLIMWDSSLRSETSICDLGISDSTLAGMLRKLPAQKKLVILDTCQAGGAATEKMLFALRGAEEVDAIKRLAESEGVAIVAAAKASEFAGEVPALGHGVFTAALLQGLDGTPGTPVTVFSLLAHLQAAVPKISRQYLSRSQYPITSAQGQDFPIVLP